MKFRTSVLLLVLASCACFWTKGVPAQDACPLYPPVVEVAGVTWYKDSKASIADPAKEAENQRMQKSIRDFTDGLSERLDQLLESKPDANVIDCIQINLVAWAERGALLKTPTWSVPVAEQTRAIVALQFIFLKLEAIGVQPPDKVRVWRHQSLLALLKAYDDVKYRNNLYVWSGVAAAAGDLLDRDDYLRRYHEAVWEFAIGAIAGDGTVAKEMERGQRALVYHTFFYNAASALWNMRNALGIKTRVADLEALQRLGNAVGEATCQPSEFERRAGAKQEMLDRWNLAMAAAFATHFNTQAWTRCTKVPSRFPGTGWGGRFDLTVKSLEAVGKSGK